MGRIRNLKVMIIHTAKPVFLQCLPRWSCEEYDLEVLGKALFRGPVVFEVRCAGGARALGW